MAYREIEDIKRIKQLSGKLGKLVSKYALKKSIGVSDTQGGTRTETFFF
jgi:hypothetical protein